jgi:hypothetical protein
VGQRHHAGSGGIVDSATEVGARIAGEGAVGDGYCVGVTDAAAAIGGCVADKGTVFDDGRAIVVQTTAPVACILLQPAVEESQ